MSLFKSQTGLFSEIPCPVGRKCRLGNCIFSHVVLRPFSDESPAPQSTKRPSATTPVEPNEKKPKKAETTEPSNAPAEVEDPQQALMPKMITSPPVQHRQRVQFLHVIRDKLYENGYARQNTRAIEIEAAVAERCTQFTYPMGIRSAVREITTKQLDNEAERAGKAARSEEQILRAELVNLLVPIQELEKRKYVTSKPDPTVLESTHIVTCARCGAKFPMYNPAATSVSCRFHLLKRQYDPRIKKLSPVFPCCGETLEESSGCERRDFHVFKLDAPSEMEGMIPFRYTPEPVDDKSWGEFAVGLDCEMAWTTKGFELIRVTVVGYISRKTIFDRLVWPKGKILDLNTRFSGVSNMEDGIEFEGRTIHAVSLEDMYKDLFKLITSKTIIIGHGLENDLNALRLIHTRVVDTAALYPRIRHRTHALKELAWDFLSRTIQTGEHDSMEDSLAAIDIVRQDIKNRCFPKEVKSFK